MCLVGWRPYFGAALGERAVMGSWSDAVAELILVVFKGHQKLVLDLSY